MIKEKKKEIVNTLNGFIKLPSEKELEEIQKNCQLWQFFYLKN